MGGIIVIFIYTRSLVSSEKLIILNFDLPFLAISSFFLVQSCRLGPPKEPIKLKTEQLYPLFNLYGRETLLFLTLYILLTLLIIVKIVQIFKGPLK
jgi:hypothetical protein